MTDLPTRLRGITITAVRANREVLGTLPIQTANATIEEAAAEIERLTALLDEASEAMTKLRDDMLERARFGMDTIHGEQYRIVNAGNGAWQGFCATLARIKEPRNALD